MSKRACTCNAELAVLRATYKDLAAELQEAKRRAADAEFERARQEIAVLATYSPRRQWTTRYGAVFVERVGFVDYPGK